LSEFLSIAQFEAELSSCLLDAVQLHKLFNDAVTTSTNTNFFLPEKPHFISKPSSSAVTVREKQHVILPCKAAGFPQPVITWYKNGLVIGKKQLVKAGHLEFKEIQFEDRGMYTCTAENLLGRDQLSVNVTVEGMYKSKNRL